MPRHVFRTSVFLLAFALAPLCLGAQAVGLVNPDGVIDWNRFYTAAETNQILTELHALYPELTELYSIGKSYRGQPLMVMEITNEATGPAGKKPALYVDGGIHAGELTGSAVATYLIGHLLRGYGEDSRITALLDTRAFYVRPKFNPDGSDIALLDDQWLRSTTHPVDEDEDGSADEDPPEDLDGDGWITQMRIPDPEGGWVMDPDDGRILHRVTPTTPAGQRYRVLREGVDNDGDGEINEDGIGGIDMNRNFPRNWERVHLQPGAGDFPLSEPETRAAVEFINSHRNITGIVHGHTAGGFVYRLPSASAPSLFPEIDLQLIVHLGEEYTRTTGRPVRPSATHPTEHRYGTLISWGYWDHGVIGWVPEYSPGPEAWVTDYDGDGEISEAESHRFNTEELGGRYFSDWTSYRHPQLGDVEVGGWHSKFWGQNPPPEFLEEETEKQIPWILYLAEQSPVLEVATPRVTPLGEGRFRVEVDIRNSGYLPTSLTDRGAVGEVEENGETSHQVVRPPWARIEVEGARVVEGPVRQNVGHLAGENPYLQAVRIVAGSDKAGVAGTGWLTIR
jgi:hypothetical protein